MFGIVNAVLRPIIKTDRLLGLPADARADLAGRQRRPADADQLLADKIDLGFHVDEFWPTAVLGALFIGVVSWLINLVIPDGKDKYRKPTSAAAAATPIGLPVPVTRITRQGARRRHDPLPCSA